MSTRALCRYCGTLTSGSYPLCDSYVCINQDNKENDMAEEPTYMIKRMYFDSPRHGEVIKKGLTLEEAQAHCNDPETSSETCTSDPGRIRTRDHGPWFDGYEVES